MSVTSDSDPVDQDDNSSDALLDSPKATSPLLRAAGGATAQKNPSHVLIRQKASYKNSIDI